LDGSGCRLLLDLHNLHANAVNVGGDVASFIDSVGVGRVGEVHVAGGRWIGPADDRRLLDDHRHDVPPAVFDALRALGERAPAPLTIILERDDAWPGMDALLAQLGAARRALADGRAAFLADPIGAARRAGLPEDVARDFADVDAVGLELQATSFAGKRGA